MSEQLLVSKKGGQDTEPNNCYGATSINSKQKEKDDNNNNNSNNNNNNNDVITTTTTTTKITYTGLLSQNKNFLFYWLSFVVNRLVRRSIVLSIEYTVFQYSIFILHTGIFAYLLI
jgi:hypothetical protein